MTTKGWVGRCFYTTEYRPRPLIGLTAHRIWITWIRTETPNLWCVLAMDVDTGQTWSAKTTWRDRKRTEHRLLEDIEGGVRHTPATTPQKRQAQNRPGRGGTLVASGVHTYKNRSPNGRLRSVKQMGEPKLLHLAKHAATEPALRKRVRAELRGLGLPVPRRTRT